MTRKHYFLLDFKHTEQAIMVETDSTYEQLSKYYGTMYDDGSLEITPVTRELYRMANKVMTALELDDFTVFGGCSKIKIPRKS